MPATSQTSPPPLAPPGGDHAKKWPKTIGILAIIYGVMGILGGISRPATAALQKIQMNNLLAGQEAIDAYLADWSSLQLTQGIVMGVVAIILLIGGIMLVKRRKVSSLIIRVWSVVYLMAGSFFVLKSLPLVSRQMELTMGSAIVGAKEGDPGVEVAGKIADVAVKVGLGIGLLWILICALFFFIWFSRRKIREEVNSWN